VKLLLRDSVIAAREKSCRRLIFGMASGFLAMLKLTAAYAQELRAATAKIAGVVDPFILVCLQRRKRWQVAGGRWQAVVVWIGKKLMISQFCGELSISKEARANG